MNRRIFLTTGAAFYLTNLENVAADAAPEEISNCTLLPADDSILSRAMAVAEWSGNKPADAVEAVVDIQKRWDPAKRVLKVAFLVEGDLADAVFSAARGWEDHMPLRFQKVRLDQSPDILVDFEPGNGHWSFLGTDSGLRSRQSKRSMNFGWSSFPEGEELKRVSLHEFGHAMGLRHEHLSPEAGISWNRKAVYAYYLRTHGWDSAKTERNVLRGLRTSQVNRTRYDPLSIMHYPIPEELLNDPSEAVGWNTNLSDADKAAVAWLWT